MRCRGAVEICVAALVFASAGLAAVESDVANAAMARDRDAVRSLVAKHADVNAPQADGATAIQWAAYNNDLELADVLIAAGSNVKLPNHDGATALSLACINGNAAMIEKLLKAGADANERLAHGETPLMMAARTGSLDALKVLVDHQADVNAKENLRGTTALMWAAEQQHPAAVRFLVEHGANLGAASNPAALGKTAYLAPTPQQRAAQKDLAGPGGGIRRARGAGGQRASAKPGAQPSEDDAFTADFFAPAQNDKGGGLTALVFAAREGDLESVKILVEAGADVNQTTRYGWTPLLTATQNRHYQIGAFLLAHGANPNMPNKGGWTPLYLATDNRNIEGGDYPVRKGDMDHLDFIKLLLDRGADPNAKMIDSTETRTIFTMQWLYEEGATAFLRAAQSGDVELMKLLLAHGADPKIPTKNGDTALMVAAGIGWVEGVTYEWSDAQSLEAVKLCIDLGLDVNTVDTDGRTALHGAAHKGRNEVVQLLVDHGAKLDAHDHGSRDTISGATLGRTWLPLNYAEGLVRVGVQSAIPHPETAALLRKLMTDRGIPLPPPITSSICLTSVCQ